jgi:tape measure domain-containing protein
MYCQEKFTAFYVFFMVLFLQGGSSEKFNRSVANFAQIQSVGKATAMDLRQFAMTGTPIYDMLNKMGVTGTPTAEDIQKVLYGSF